MLCPPPNSIGLQYMDYRVKIKEILKLFLKYDFIDFQYNGSPFPKFTLGQFQTMFLMCSLYDKSQVFD